MTIDAAVTAALTATGSPVPIDDERAIQRLVLAYGLCADFARIDELGALFTPDARWDGRQFRFPLCEGIDEIRDHFARVCEPGTRQVHVMELPLVVAGDDTDSATGVVQFNAMLADGSGGVTASQHAFGIYEDAYRRTPDGWKIHTRVLHLRLVRR